jgi:digeranylgeranylglycerophospholipid reductase
MSLFIDRGICGYCGACISVCPNSAIELIDTYVRRNQSLCTGCLACVKVCPLGAMKLDAGCSMPGAQAYLPVPSGNRKSKIKNQKSVDVLVIGGGPAGSMAAKAAVQQNVDVLMVEKRQEIGSPVRCAEGVSKRALAELIELNPKWISAEINGGRIHSPDGSFVTIDEPGAGLVLERKIFDRELAAQAARSGAEIWVKARAIDLISENGGITGAVIRRSDGDHNVRAKVVIAADGVESQVAKWAGINTTCRTSRVDACAQYLMTGLTDIDLSYCDFYLGHQIAPRGYAWIFPKGDDSANVGVGIGGNVGGGPASVESGGQTAIDYLNRFVGKEILKGKTRKPEIRKAGNPENRPSGSPDFRSSSSVLSLVVGCVPVAGMLSDVVRDGFMIVGDAAHQNDPVSGGGIINSMVAGQIAGEVAGRAVRNGDVSHAVLAEYQKRWHQQIGRTFRHLRRLREGILKFSDETLNDIAKVLSQTNSKLTLTDIFWTALRNDPKLLLELRHLIAIGWAQ